MGTPLKPAPLARVRSLFAHTFLGEGAQTDARQRALGAITLLPAQCETVRRARETITGYGGVLIADDVGTGKTFVALALCADAARPIVFGPAALGGMWAGAAARARVAIPFVSIESMGRGREPPTGHDFVIVDEAHHLRNPATRRYAAIRAVVGSARVVLLSATPIHNRARDLDALLALIVGPGAPDLDDATRAHVIVRSTHAGAGPHAVVHRSLAVRDVRGIVGAVRNLPSALAPRDAGDAPALLRLSLLRAWCSSVGAFASMVRRATLHAAALDDAFRAGRHPTRAELRAWAIAGDGQLAFAELVAPAEHVATFDAAAIESHLAGLAVLRDFACAHPAIDDERAELLLRIAAAHPGIPVLACTQYAATVDALWKRLRLRPGVAALTSRGARIASGPIARAQALERFAPIAQGAPRPHAREQIQLLITTDLVSEGLNLHDAGVVVHLDLPWTAARLAQRVGRIARLGSTYTRVHAYALAPPRAAATLLALERRLRTKRRIAAHLVGGGARVAELLGGADGGAEGPAEAHARILNLLARHASEPAMTAGAIVCGVGAPCNGWLALVTSPYGPRLAIRIGRARPTTDPRMVVRGVEWLAIREERWLSASWDRTLRDVERWLAHDRARQLSSADRRHAARAHGRALAATVATVGDAPPHERARAAGAASERMRALTAQGTPNNSQFLLALVIFCTDDPAPDRSPL